MKIALVLLSLVLLQKDPTASDAWAQASGDAAFVYATINNPSMYDVFLVSGKSDAAAQVELLNVDAVVKTLTVPAYGSLELTATGTRIRVSGLKTPLKAGDELQLTLDTDGGASILIAAAVK